MIFGSINIENTNNNFKISPLNESPFFSIFIDSLQLPFRDYFFANSVSYLSQFIQNTSFTPVTAHILLSSLYNQLHILDQNNITISFLDINDILVIDNSFFICNFDKFYKYNYHNNTILISDVYDKNNPYLTPLFKSNTSIPFTSHKNDFFYNLALIVLDCFRKTNFLLYNHNDKQILNYYHYTKIYNTLVFFLNTDVSKRQFIIF